MLKLIHLHLKEVIRCRFLGWQPDRSSSRLSKLVPSLWRHQRQEDSKYIFFTFGPDALDELVACNYVAHLKKNVAKQLPFTRKTLKLFLILLLSFHTNLPGQSLQVEWRIRVLCSSGANRRTGRSDMKIRWSLGLHLDQPCSPPNVIWHCLEIAICSSYTIKLKCFKRKVRMKHWQ